jgi:very-short-patch-repair endonuclease
MTPRIALTEAERERTLAKGEEIAKRVIEVRPQATRDLGELFHGLELTDNHRSDSTIEAALSVALIGLLGMECTGDLKAGWGAFLLGYSERLSAEVKIMQQHKISSYRVDILLMLKKNGEIWPFIIECDGHDYHERTKEQARRDRSRDRWFQLQGLMVIRFTGSEIWEDAVACAEQVIDIIAAKIARA